jgi:hypothetical protein
MESIWLVLVTLMLVLSGILGLALVTRAPTRPRGLLGPIGIQGYRVLPVDRVRQFGAAQKAPSWQPHPGWRAGAPVAGGAGGLGRCRGRGPVRPVVDQVLELADAALAHRRIESRRPRQGRAAGGQVTNPAGRAAFGTGVQELARGNRPAGCGPSAQPPLSCIDSPRLPAHPPSHAVAARPRTLTAAHH